MKINEISVSIGQTMQIGQYEPRNYHVSYKIEVQDGESVAELTRQAKQILTKEIEDYFKIKAEDSPFKE